MVARLNMSQPEWVLYLGSESPPEDQCWALLDVLTILVHGADPAPALPAPRLHLVPD